jgi:hypothetical protein
MAALNKADPIWGAMPADVTSWGDGLEVTCARAGGRYRMTGTALAQLGELSRSERAKLTRWIVDANRLEGKPPEISTDTLKRVRVLPERTVAQRMDRLLAHLARRGARPGARLSWMGTHQVTPQTERSKQEALAAIDAVEDSELPAFRALLEDAGMLRNDGNSIKNCPLGVSNPTHLATGAKANRGARWWNGQPGKHLRRAQRGVVRNRGQP